MTKHKQLHNIALIQDGIFKYESVSPRLHSSLYYMIWVVLFRKIRYPITLKLEHVKYWNLD